MSDEASETALRPTSIPALLIFRGTLSRGRYFAGIAVALGILLSALVFAADAMSPTGGGTPLLAIPLILCYVWIHAGLLVARLRDAGHSAWFALLALLGAIAWFWIAIELIETDEGWLVGFAGFVLFYILPGLLRRKDKIISA